MRAVATPETGGRPLLSPCPPRSFGALALEFVAADGVTRIRRSFQEGVMRVRFPRGLGDAPLEAVLINTAGGLTGGDRIAIDVVLQAGARAVLTTQAHEKVYRASQDAACVNASLRAGAGTTLEWLPQPTILFNSARLQRRTEIVLEESATFLGVEAVIFGRTAMAETMRNGALTDHWTIRHGGRLIHADRFVLHGDIAAHLSKASVLKGSAAMATLRYVGADAMAKLEMVRALLRGDGATSVLNGMLLVRLVAEDGYRLGLALSRLLTQMRGRPLPKVWTI